MKKLLFIIFANIFLIGCASTQEPINTAFFKIHDGTFRSSVGTWENYAEFSIDIPKPRADNPYEMKDLNIVEEQYTDATNVHINRGVYDQSIYSLIIDIREGMSESNFEKTFLDSWLLSVENIYKQRLVQIFKKNTFVHGQPATYSVYKMEIPEFEDSQGVKYKNVIMTHSLYHVYYEHYIVTFSVFAFNFGYPSIKDPEILVKEKWEVQNEFVNSFKLYPKY